MDSTTRYRRATETAYTAVNAREFDLQISASPYGATSTAAGTFRSASYQTPISRSEYGACHGLDLFGQGRNDAYESRRQRREPRIFINHEAVHPPVAAHKCSAPRARKLDAEAARRPESVCLVRQVSHRYLPASCRSPSALGARAAARSTTQGGCVSGNE